MPFWVRRMLVWFEGDANLEQEISRFMLLGSSVPSLDAPKLEVSVESWVRLRPAAADSMLLPGVTSRLASASSPGYARRFNLLHHVVDNPWSFLSSRFVVSTQVDASPASGDDFVARPALPRVVPSNENKRTFAQFWPNKRFFFLVQNKRTFPILNLTCFRADFEAI